jgi:hypothetical protein
MLLGETTFHQVHGGIATNVMESGAAVCAENKRNRGVRYERPTGWPLFVGRLNLPALAAMRRSLVLLEREAKGTPEPAK